MSRIGKKAIDIPEGVKINLVSKNITVTGPKGSLTFKHRAAVGVKIEGNQIKIRPTRDDHFAKSVWGLTRTLIFNMIIGVTQGFTKKLEFSGVGFRAEVEKVSSMEEKLVLQVGFSHPVEIIAPKDIKFSVQKNIITIEGIDKELVGQITAKIRAIKPPEPYKGKGIKYIDEVVRRKAGKSVVKEAA